MAGTAWRGFPPTIAVLAKRYLCHLSCPAKLWKQFFGKRSPASRALNWTGSLPPPLGALIRDAYASSAVADAAINTLTTNISLRSKLPS